MGNLSPAVNRFMVNMRAKAFENEPTLLRLSLNKQHQNTTQKNIQSSHRAAKQHKVGPVYKVSSPSVLSPTL